MSWQDFQDYTPIDNIDKNWALVMITEEKLRALLDKVDKTDRDLIRYVCNGLRAYDVNQRPVYPARLLLATWQEEATRVAETHLLFEEEAARLDVSAHDLMTEYLTHRRVMRDMIADEANRYHRKLPVGIFEELLARDVTIKQLIENLPDGENRRMAQRKLEAASVLEMLDRDAFEGVRQRITALVKLVSNGEPIPLQWFLSVFTQTAIDGLAAELMGCYYECRDVERFINSDEQAETTKEEKAVIPADQSGGSHEEFIRATHIKVSDEETLNIMLPDKKQVIQTKDTLGFQRAQKAWDMLMLIIGNGKVSLGVIPRDKEAYKPGEKIPSAYDKGRKTLGRISKKLTVFFNKECRLDLPSGFKFFENDKSASDRGFFKPIFKTDHEREGIELLREFERKGVSVAKVRSELSKK